MGFPTHSTELLNQCFPVKLYMTDTARFSVLGTYFWALYTTIWTCTLYVCLLWFLSQLIPSRKGLPLRLTLSGLKCRFRLVKCHSKGPHIFFQLKLKFYREGKCHQLILVPYYLNTNAAPSSALQ